MCRVASSSPPRTRSDDALSESPDLTRFPGWHNNRRLGRPSTGLNGFNDVVFDLVLAGSIDAGRPTSGP